MRIQAIAWLAAITTSGCAATVSDHLGAGRLEEAWAATCRRDAEDLTVHEMRSLQAELEARTRIELRGDALSGAEANARFGAKTAGASSTSGGVSRSLPSPLRRTR